MRRRGILLLSVFHTLLIVAGASAGLDASRAIDLRPHWEEGDAFYIEWDWTSENIWTRKGASGYWIGNTHDRFGFIFRVEAIQPNGTARIKLTYDRMESAYWWGNEREEGDAWDSDTDPPDAQSKLRTVLQPMLGVTLTMEVDRDGRIVSFTGADALRRKVEQADPDKDALKWFDKCLDGQSQRSRWEHWLGMYAFKPVERCDEWKREISSAIHDQAITYSLDRINTYEDHVLAIVHFKGRGIPRADCKTEEIGDGATWEYGESSFTGRSTFDSRRGLIVRRRVEGRRLSSRTGQNPESGKKERYKVRTTSKGRLLTLTLEERDTQKHSSAAPLTQP